MNGFFFNIVGEISFCFFIFYFAGVFQETFNLDGQNFSACLLTNKVNVYIVQADAPEKDKRQIHCLEKQREAKNYPFYLPT